MSVFACLLRRRAQCSESLHLWQVVVAAAEMSLQARDFIAIRFTLMERVEDPMSGHDLHRRHEFF